MSNKFGKVMIDDIPETSHTIAYRLFREAWNEYTKDVDLSTLRVGGRATKEYPNKEDAEFWEIKGPEWVQSYIQWREFNNRYHT